MFCLFAAIWIQSQKYQTSIESKYQICIHKDTIALLTHRTGSGVEEEDYITVW